MTQSQALSILKTGANVFLTGEPGSGKTYLINQYVSYLQSVGIEPAITASTGIAATHIGGMTIHSWSGIGIKTKLSKQDLNKIVLNKYITRRIRRAKVLIIDEISMLLPGTLSMIDSVCREVRQELKPFGGMQVVLVGDFFQLPPIIRRAEDNNGQAELIKESPALFAYDSSSWAQLNPTVCYLTEQYRQDDSNFLEILSSIRRNAFDDNHLRHIETRKIEYLSAPPGVPQFFSHNIDVNRVNEEMLTQLLGAPETFPMYSQGPDALVAGLKRGCLSPETLSLKIGAAVMFTKNSPKDGFVNGTLGTVVEFDKISGYPVIRMRNGRRVSVKPMDWMIEEDNKTRAKITQIPLRLAWAITVHKSQGMSLEAAVMDLSAVFEFGQGYVALSRVSRLSGLYLLGWNEHAFKVHPEVLIKDKFFQLASKETEAKFAKILPVKFAKMNEDFIADCAGENVFKCETIKNPIKRKRRRKTEPNFIDLYE